MEFNELIGTGSDAIVELRNDLGKGEGDQITFGIRLPLQGQGIVGDKTVEGNEEKLRFRNYKITIEELNHAVDTGGKMDEQRIPYNLMQEGKIALQEWWITMLSNLMMNTLAGNSNYRIAGEVFANPIREPDEDHWIRMNDKAEVDMNSSDIIDLSFLDKMKQRAYMPTNTAFKLRPLVVNGKEYFRVYLHSYVFDNLRQNTNIGQWGDLLRNANKLQLENVEIEYNGMLITRSERLPEVQPGVYRSVLLGKQAGVWAWGGAGDSKSSTMAFVPYTKDAERFVMIRGGGIFGMDKPNFITPGSSTARDYGVITGSCWGEPIN
jgi:N4-gp56 family major capsid protein